jgi:hypothetical protein
VRRQAGTAGGVTSGFRNRIGLAILATTALLLFGCAAQGPPHPPRVEKPERITDLTAIQVGHTIEVSFTLPTQATDGEGLSRPLELQLFRVVTPPGQKPSAPPAESHAWVTLLPSELTRYQRGEKIVYPDHLSDQEYFQQLGASFTFAADGLTRGFRHRPVKGDLSNRIAVTLLDVSPPVETPRCETTEHALELSWPPPTTSLSGRPLHELAGYRVFRSDTAKGLFDSRGETPVAQFRDPDFQFERSYFYRVRALFKSGSQLAESEDSKLCAITPRDTFPPAAPAALSAISTAAGVELIWDANTEPDLAGYNVYRREGEGAPHKLNSELVGTPLYRDEGVEAGRRYAYWVAAVDSAGNESPPSGVAVVAVP